MFCPKCGQNQASEALRFCPRCGFSLSEVVALLVTDGTRAGDEPPLRRLLARFGAKLIFLSLILLPFALMASFGFNSPLPLLTPLILFTIGAAHVLYIQLFGEFPIARKPDRLDPARTRSSLRPPLSDPIPASGIKPADTAEIIQPPSVTESTTRLLEADGRVRN
jgi:hypothetical protein